MAGPEFNPADDIQPTKEEYEAWEQEQPVPDTCVECGEFSVGYDEGTPLCAEHYLSRLAHPSNPGTADGESAEQNR